MTWNAKQPNNSLAKLPPKGFLLNEEQQSLLLECVGALARLDEAALVLADSSLIANALPMVEVVASNAIENIVTTHDSIFVADASTTQPVSASTILAIRNRAAFRLGYEAVGKRPISIKLLSDIASELLGYKVSIRSLSGTYIGNTSNPVYTPPDGKERIEGMLSDLVTFIGADLMHPILVMILSHYQFEAIHPFADGNGRTGRVLNQLILKQSGLLRSPVLNLSGYLVQNRNEYYARLHAVESSGDWSGWITFMLQAILDSAKQSHLRIRQLFELQRLFDVDLVSRVGKYSSSLSILLFEKPYCQIGHVVESLGVSRPTAAKLLETLESSGHLTSFVSGKEKFFVNRSLLEVLAD